MRRSEIALRSRTRKLAAAAAAMVEHQKTNRSPVTPLTVAIATHAMSLVGLIAYVDSVDVDPPASKRKRARSSKPSNRSKKP